MSTKTSLYLLNGTSVANLKATSHTKFEHQTMYPMKNFTRTLMLLCLCLGIHYSSFANCTPQSENFSNYSTNQRIGPQSSLWTTWSGNEGGSEDGIVHSSNGNKMLLINTYQVQDVIYKLGNRSSGKYELGWKMLSNNSGYFNIQTSETNRVSGGKFGVFFTGSTGQVVVSGGGSATFSHTPNTWVDIKITADFTTGVHSVKINNTLFTLNGLSNFALGAINFYATTNASFYVDDIYLEDINCDDGETYNCNDATPIACGATINASTFGASSNYNYTDLGACASGINSTSNPFTGADRLYKLNVPSGSNLSISMSNMTNDLDMFLFDNCNSGNLSNCLERSINSNNTSEQITLPNAGGTYYLLIDGYNSNIAGNFRLSVDCEDCPSTAIVCDDINYTFTGTAQTTRYLFSVPTHIPSTGTWKAIRNNSTQVLGSGSSLTATFPNNGEYTIQYEYYDSNGCLHICSVILCIENPYSCQAINENFSSNNQYILSIPVASSNVSKWVDDDTGAILGTGATITIANPSPQQCRNVSVYYYDSSSECYKVCCAEICHYNVCPTDIDNNCSAISYAYQGVNGSLKYKFEVPTYLPSNGSWTAKVNNITSTIGNGRTVIKTFNTAGNYEICYTYTDSDGCPHSCCITVWIGNPYECNIVEYVLWNGAYQLTLAGIPAQHIVTWQDDDTGAALGSNSSILVYPDGNCGKRNFSVKFYDPSCNCYKVCCISLWICDPFDCDDIVSTYNASSNSFSLTAQGISSSNVVKWQNDDTGANLGSNTSAWLPNTGSCVNVSLYYFDPTCNCYKVCCLQVCPPQNCPPEEDTDCNLVGYSYVGNNNGGNSYSFSMPNYYPWGTWTAEHNGTTTTIGSGYNVTTTFWSTGSYKICYQYTDSDGCIRKCCKTVWINNPYECNFIEYELWNGGYQLTLAGIPSQHIISWQDDDNGAQLGTNSSIVVYPNGNCGKRNFSVKFYDPSCNCYRVCCISVWICDPFDCDDIVSTYNASSNSFTVTAQGINADNVVYWKNDNTGANLGSNTSAWLANTGSCVNVSLYYFDPTCNCYKVCCLEICPPQNCPPEEDPNCSLVGYSYVSNNNGGNNYSFSVPNSYPWGTWTAEYNGTTTTIGSGYNVTTTFWATGSHKICYQYTDADGCVHKCCKTIWIDNPYECNFIDYVLSNGAYQLTLASIPAQHIISWQDDDNGAQLGTGNSILIYPNNNCGKRNFSVKFYDPSCNCYRVCCISLWVCDPFDCDDIVSTYDANSNSFTVTAQGINADNVVYWRNDSTGANLGSNTSAWLPNTGSCVNVSLYYYDPTCGCYKVCCLEVCPPDDCCADSDLDNWLPIKIAEIENTLGCTPHVKCCKLNGQKVIDISTTHCSDHGCGFIYDCYGNIKEVYGTIAGVPAPNLTNCVDLTPQGPCVKASENFDNYNLGSISNQSSHWTTSNTYQTIDGQVVWGTDGKALEIGQPYYSNTLGDATYALGNANNDICNLSWEMKVISNNKATVTLYNNQWATTNGQASLFVMEFENGLAKVKAEGKEVWFPYPEGTFFEVGMRVNQLTGEVQVYPPNSVYTISWVSTNTQLGALNFRTTEFGDSFQVDNILIEGVYCSDYAGFSNIDDNTEAAHNISLDNVPDASNRTSLTSYPNPFSKNTTISFELPQEMEVTLSILNAQGKVIHTINGDYSKGKHEIDFSKKEEITPGLYYVRLQGDDLQRTHSMIMVE